MSLRIVFRVDASLQIGAGHVMRCLALASALRVAEARCIFICREHTGNLIELIVREGHEVVRLPMPEVAPAPTIMTPQSSWLGTDWDIDAQQTLVALTDISPNWLIVDHYALDAAWEGQVQRSCRRLMVIDDLANRQHDCDLLLDQNLMANMYTRYDGRLTERSAKLIGPEYALLQPGYAALHEQARARSGPPQRVSIFFGGVDADNVTYTTLVALLKLSRPDIQVDVVIGQNNPHRSALETLVSDVPHIHLHQPRPSLGPMLLAADLAIGAGGSASWERLCVGLPSLVITLADNQRPIAEELHKRGLVLWLGDAHHIEIDILTAQIGEALRQSLDVWSANCLRVVDGLGARRVCSALLVDRSTELIARSARISDEAQLLEWANDPMTRRNSFSSAQISPEDHQLWFSCRLKSTDCHIYIVETAAGLAVGQVCFERAREAWEVHFSLSRALRGRGLGVSLLKVALGDFKVVQPEVTVFGQVKSANRASCRMFEVLGFRLASAVDANVAIYQSNQF